MTIGTHYPWFRLFGSAIIIASLAAVLSFSGIGTAARATEVSSAAGSSDLPGADGAAIDLGKIDRADLHTDLDSLADAWASGGGDQGYPFWDQAWRQWQTGAMAGTTFQPFAASYASLLARGSERVKQLDLSTQPAMQVRVVIERSLQAREAGLADLDAYLAAEVAKSEDVKGETFEVVRTRIGEEIDSSYRDARLAMNSAQALLDAAGQRRIPEDSFL